MDKEQKREYNRKWRAEHAEHKRQYDKDWREEHPEYRKQYRMEHPEHIAEQVKKYFNRHQERIREYKREYYMKWSASFVKKRYQKIPGYRSSPYANQARRRAMIRNARIGRIDYEAIKTRDRMICCICGKKVTKKDLSFDHSVPLSLGGSHTQENIRVAHLRCNIIRGAGRLPVQMVLV